MPYRRARSTTSRRARVTIPKRRCPASSATHPSPATARRSARPFRRHDQLTRRQDHRPYDAHGSRFVRGGDRLRSSTRPTTFVITTTPTATTWPAAADVMRARCARLATGSPCTPSSMFLRVRPGRRADVLRPRGERQRPRPARGDDPAVRPEDTDAGRVVGRRRHRRRRLDRGDKHVGSSVSGHDTRSDGAGTERPGSGRLRRRLVPRPRRLAADRVVGRRADPDR